jgi:hypothetical protein
VVRHASSGFECPGPPAPLDHRIGNAGHLEDERTSTGGESATLTSKVAFAKGHNRSNREIGKPKQE